MTYSDLLVLACCVMVLGGGSVALWWLLLLVRDVRQIRRHMDGISLLYYAMAEHMAAQIDPEQEWD